MRSRFGLYAHWPWCARICPYCDFNVYRARSADWNGMAKAMAAHLALWKRNGAPQRPLDSLHFGGGTPSLAPPEALTAVIEAAEREYGFAPDAEIGLEANPEDAHPERWRAYRAAGVERISLGVQALDDEALQRLGRMHSAAQARDAIMLALEIFPRVSADFIYARPGQAVADWRGELNRALSLGLKHLSAYQLTIEPGTAFGKQFARGTLTPPDADAAADFYEATQEVCEAAGLPAYEVSNHAASPEHQSRHNRLYWESGDWIAVGPGGHARLWAEDGARRSFATLRRPGAYLEAVESGGPAEENEMLDSEAAGQEMILMGLRVTDGLDLTALKARSGLSPDPEALAAFIQQGLIAQNGNRIAATPAGRILLDRVAAELIP